MSLGSVGGQILSFLSFLCGWGIEIWGMEFPELVFQSQDWNHACFCTKFNLLIIMFYYLPGTSKNEKWSRSVVWLFATPWTVAHQAYPSMGTNKLNTYLFLVCPEWNIAISSLSLYCFCLLLHNFEKLRTRILVCPHLVLSSSLDLPSALLQLTLLPDGDEDGIIKFMKRSVTVKISDTVLRFM